jgi:hypothetical protein
MFDTNDPYYYELLGKFSSRKSSLIMTIHEKISEFSEDELDDLLSIIIYCHDGHN